MTQDLKQIVEKEAENRYPTGYFPSGDRLCFESGAYYGLTLNRWVKIDPNLIPDIPIGHDNRSINVILTDGEERVSSGYYNFNRQMWFWVDMAMEKATHYMLQQPPPPPLP